MMRVMCDAAAEIMDLKDQRCIFITVKIYFIQHFTLQIFKNYAYCYK